MFPTYKVPFPQVQGAIPSEMNNLVTKSDALKLSFGHIAAMIGIIIMLTTLVLCRIVRRYRRSLPKRWLTKGNRS